RSNRGCRTGPSGRPSRTCRERGPERSWSRAPVLPAHRKPHNPSPSTSSTQSSSSRYASSFSSFNEEIETPPRRREQKKWSDYFRRLRQADANSHADFRRQRAADRVAGPALHAVFEEAVAERRGIADQRAHIGLRKLGRE